MHDYIKKLETIVYVFRNFCNCQKFFSDIEK